MKKQLLFATLFAVLTLSSCGGSSSPNSLTLEELNNKISNKETFTFAIIDNSAEGKDFNKSVIQYYNDRNIKQIYTIQYDKLSSDDKKALSSQVYEYFGPTQYKKYDATKDSIKIPTTIKIESGYFKTGSLYKFGSPQLTSIINADDVKLPDFYAYDRKVQNNESFTVYFYYEFHNAFPYAFDGYYYMPYTDMTEDEKEILESRVGEYYESLGEYNHGLTRDLQLTYTNGVITSHKNH